MRFRIDSVDNTRYITIPFDLFSHPKYAGLDAMTKLIYGFLKSRMNLSKMNNWVDENAFFTVGKAWGHGLIPYRDMFEQKGPVLFLIFTFI